MLKKVRKFVDLMMKSEEPFQQYYLGYMKKVQDQNIDREVKNQIRFSILQLYHLDNQIEADYRKLVNERNAKFGGS